MALTKAAVAVLASTSVAAGGTRAGNVVTGGVTGTAVDVRAYYGGDIGWSITNGASAPGVALTLVIQTSPDGTKWYDFYTVGGDIFANSVFSNTIVLDLPVMYIRAIAYGNTVNAVTVEVSLQAITAY